MENVERPIAVEGGRKGRMGQISDGIIAVSAVYADV